jgi:hypothetical protein
MNNIFFLYRDPREVGRLTVAALLDYLIKGWGLSGAVNVLIGGGETFSQKTYEAASGIPGIIVNARRVWYALQHQEEIRRALSYMQENLPSIEQARDLGAKSQLVYNKLSQVLANIQLGLGQLSQTNVLDLRTSFDHAVQAQTHFSNAYHLAPNPPEMKEMLEVVRTGSAALVRTYEFLQQVDYQRIYFTLHNIADNFEADEFGMTVGIAFGAFTLTYLFGTIVAARARRGVPTLLTRFRQDWGAKRFPDWYKKNIRKVLGDNLYRAARRSVEEDLRTQGRLKE